LFYKPTAIGAIPGFLADPDAIHGKTLNKRMSFGDHLAREVEKKTASKGSDKHHGSRRSSVDKHHGSRRSSVDKQHAAKRRSSIERSRDFTFTGDDNPFHLWYPAKVRIDHRDYESAGHYLVVKSLGKYHT